MNPTRATRSKSGKWESIFSFPNVGVGYVADPICMWKDSKWTYLGGGLVGIFPEEFKLPEDPLASVLSDGKAFKIVTRSGFSYRMPDERVVKKPVGEGQYLIVDVPSVFEVWLGMAMFRVLGYFGYCEALKSVVIFNVKNGSSEVYGCTMVDSEALFGAHDVVSAQNPLFNAHPSYSPEFVMVKAKTSVQKLAEEIDDEVKNRVYHPGEEYVSDPEDDNNKEILKQVRKSMEREALLRDQLMKLIDPTQEVEVEVVTVEGGKFAKKKHKTSDLIRKLSVDEAIAKAQAKFEDEQKKLRKDMGITEDGIFPMPINVATTPAKPIQMELPELKPVKDKDLFKPLSPEAEKLIKVPNLVKRIKKLLKRSEDVDEDLL